MSYLPVSDDMKKKLEQYFDADKNRYDIEAVRNIPKSEPRRRYSDLFAGTSHDGQNTEHTMLSAAIALNKELEAEEEEKATNLIDSVDLFAIPPENAFMPKIMDVVDHVVKHDGESNNIKTAVSIWNGREFPDWKKKHVAKIFVHLLDVELPAIYEQFESERQAYLSDKVSNERPNSQRYENAHTIKNRILFFCEEIRLGYGVNGNDDVQSTRTDLTSLYELAHGKKPKPVLATDGLPEEYLASIGL